MADTLPLSFNPDSIFHRGSRTYYNASKFFPKTLRRRVTTLYAFVRTADDYVDATPQDASGFAAFRGRWNSAANGTMTGDPVVDNFAALASDGFILLIWAVASYAAAFALEAAGVATGAIFGPYEYSSVLGTNILRVPPIIGFNWIVVVSGCATLATFLVYIGMPKVDGGRSMRVIRILVIALVSGILAAAFDWVMEPAAVALDYWTWLVPTIPFQNYFTWFAFTAVSTGVWASMTRNHVFRTRYMFSKPWKTRNRRETWGLFIFPYHCWSSLAWRVLASWSGGKPASQ
jgi:hypothetical protein